MIFGLNACTGYTANKENICHESQRHHQAPWLFDFVGHRVNPAATIQRNPGKPDCTKKKVLKLEAL
jgi:hypothetical protein